MPNPIKYSTSAQTLALKKGNYWIGTGDVGKGPTSVTDYYNGITPPSGGYTIYLNKASGGPSIYTAANDAALISLTNSIAGASYTTVGQCFTYYDGQSDKMCMNSDLPLVQTLGLTFFYAPSNVTSYIRSGTTIKDLSANGYNGSMTAGVAYSSGENALAFDSTGDYITNSLAAQRWDNTPWSIVMKVKFNSYDDQFPFQLAGYNGGSWFAPFYLSGSGTTVYSYWGGGSLNGDGGTTNFTGNPMTTGTVHNIGISFNGQGAGVRSSLHANTKIYFNNQIKNIESDGGSGGFQTDGKVYVGSPNFGFYGNLYYFALWNGTQLSDSVMQTILSNL